jgi:hypothetical protein
MARTFNPDDLDALVELLKADQDLEVVRTVSLNPDEVQLPGVWVRLDTIGGPSTLAGLALNVTLFLIVAEAGGFARILGKLAPLYDAISAKLDAAGLAYGPATRTGVILPANVSTPMPALSIPVTVPTVN